MGTMISRRSLFGFALVPLAAKLPAVPPSPDIAVGTVGPWAFDAVPGYWVEIVNDIRDGQGQRMTILSAIKELDNRHCTAA